MEKFADFAGGGPNKKPQIKFVETILQNEEDCKPLLNLIKNSSDKLALDFGGFGSTTGETESWMGKYSKITRRISPALTPAILLQICQDSVGKGIKLLNVQHSLLPIASELTPAQMSNLDACIESIHMIDPDETHSQKYFPTTAEITLTISDPSNFDLNPNLNITTIHWLSWKTIGVKNNPKDLPDLDPKIYEDLFENDRQELIQRYFAQNVPIFIEDTLVNLKVEVSEKLPNLKCLYLFALYGFRDYNYSSADWMDMGMHSEDIFKFEF